MKLFSNWTSNLKAKQYKYLSLILVIIIISGIGFINQIDLKATNSYESASATLLKSEMSLSNKITEKFMKSTETLPFTYSLNGKKKRGIPSSYKPIMTFKTVDSNMVKTTIRGTDPVSKLKITFEMTTYKDFPVVEWIVWFQATGSTKTQLISDINAIDYRFEGSNPSLTHCNGDFYSADGYTTEKTNLNGQNLTFEPTGGRPCDGAFPYYRLNFKDYGITMAIGWPSQWYAAFKGTAKNVTVLSGQGNISTKLNPGEKIRSPRMTLLTYKNGEQNGINVWRSWFRKYILIKPDGNEIKPLYASNSTDPGEEETGSTETNQLNFINKFASKGFVNDVWWLDAGWYYCYDATINQNKWFQTGNWRPDPIRFPNGLKSVSDSIHEKGGKFLLWFEPERVYPGTALAKEHPEWMLHGSYGSKTSSMLLNLGNADCRKWLTDYIDKMIKDNGIDIYRQDFNFQPLDNMMNYDKEGRTGIVENLCVQGYLQYWDDLLARNPGLIIDSCASGGRRNDLESMRRAVPLHYSDFGYGNTVVKQSFQDTLYQWFLYFKDGAMSDEFAQANSLRDKNNQLDPANDVDEFAAYAGMAPFLYSAVDMKNNNFDFATTLKFKKYWEQINRQLIDGDYYLLTKDTRTDDMWTVRQFDLPATNEGVFQVFRNINNKDANFTIKPKGAISTDLSYEITNVATEVKTTITGSDWIKNGFTVTLGKREACILKYKAI